MANIYLIAGMLFGFNAFAAYPQSECPKNLEGQWHCVANPYYESWKGLWKDEDKTIFSKRDGEKIVSYTINNQETVLDNTWKSYPPAENGRLPWGLARCQSGALVLCMSITDTNGNLIGGQLCTQYKLDRPNEFSYPESGGNVTYSCQRTK